MITNSKRIYKNTSVLIIAQNVRKDKKLKEEIRKIKKIHRTAEKIVLGLNNAVFIVEPNKANNDETLRFGNLMFEKMYGESYLSVFMETIQKEGSSTDAKLKYNFKKINKHLIKTIEEYKQLTDELDEAIFGKAGV